MACQLKQDLIGLTFTTKEEMTLLDPDRSQVREGIYCQGLLLIYQPHVLAVVNSCSASCNRVTTEDISPSITVMSCPLSRLPADGTPISTFPRIGFLRPKPGALSRSRSFIRTHCSFTAPL